MNNMMEPSMLYNLTKKMLTIWAQKTCDIKNIKSLEMLSIPIINNLLEWPRVFSDFIHNG